MNLTLLSDEAQFLALAPEWNELLQESAANNIFLTWEWLSAWLRWFGAEYQPWVVTARQADGRLLGVAPLAVRRRVQSGLLPYRELVFLGSNQAAPDHLDFIARRETADMVAPALAQYVWDNRAEWDMLRLESAAKDGAAATYLPLCAPPRWQQVSEMVCPFTPLPASWADFRQQLGKNLRYNIGRDDRRLARLGEMRYTQAADLAELPEALAALRRLHLVSRRGEAAAAAFWHERMVGFQQEIAARFLENGWLRFYRLQLDGRDIALTYNFYYGNKLSYYMTGYDRAWSRYGPGRQVMAGTIRCAIAEGAREIDFLRGEEAYKFAWTARRRVTLRLEMAAGRRGRLLMQARRLKGAMRGGRSTG